MSRFLFFAFLSSGVSLRAFDKAAHMKFKSVTSSFGPTKACADQHSTIIHTNLVTHLMIHFPLLHLLHNHGGHLTGVSHSLGEGL